MSEIRIYNFQIPGARGKLIYGDMRVLHTNAKVRPLIIFCHGFKGFKDWGCWPYVADEFAKRGFAFLKFNFSHSGIGRNLTEFTELKKFQENTFSLEAEDLKLVLEALKRREIPGRQLYDPTHIGLIGHSRGGAAVICSGNTMEVKAIATLASISSLGTVSPELETEWREKGVRYVTNARTKQEMPLGIALLDDIKAGKDRIEKAADALNKPLLVIHGTADDAVPVSAAIDLSTWSNDARMELLADANHVFGAKHPFEGTTPDLERVISLINDFFAPRLA